MQQSAPHPESALPHGWVARSYPAVFDCWPTPESLCAVDARAIARIVYSECERFCVITHAQFCRRIGLPTGNQGGRRCQRAVRLLEDLGVLQCVDRSRGQAARAIHRLCDPFEAHRLHGLGVAVESQMQFDFGEAEEVDRGPGLVEIRLFNPSRVTDSAASESVTRDGFSQVNPSPDGFQSVTRDGFSSGAHAGDDAQESAGKVAGATQRNSSQRIESTGDDPAASGTTAASVESEHFVASTGHPPAGSRVRARPQETQERDLSLTQPSSAQELNPPATVPPGASAPDADDEIALLEALRRKRIELESAGNEQPLGAALAVAHRVDPDRQREDWQRRLCRQFSQPRDWWLARRVAADVVAGRIDVDELTGKIDYAMHKADDPPAALYGLLRILYDKLSLPPLKQRKKRTR